MILTDNQWTAISPGVMELPTTKFRITHEAGSLWPFKVTWDGQPIPSGECGTLALAQSAAAAHMADLIMMGVEV